MAGMAQNEIRELAKDLERQGANLIYKKDGIMVRLPDGSSQMLHFTNSDRRAHMNIRAAVKRAGLTWPGDGAQPRRRGGSITKRSEERIRRVFVDTGLNELAPHTLTEAGIGADLLRRALLVDNPILTQEEKGGPYRLVSETTPEPTPEDLALDEMDDKPEYEPETSVEEIKKMFGAEPEPEHPNIEYAKSLLATAAKPTVDFIDDRDSWVVDLHPLPPTMTLRDLLDTYVAAGLGMEIRVWRTAK